MAAATTQVNTIGRGPNLNCAVSVISVTVTATATTYTTATGGLPFDLTTALQTASGGMMQGGIAPNYTQTVNPADIYGCLPLQLSTNGFLPQSLTVGTPTYTNVPWQSDNGPGATLGILATCPCTVRLWGTGASNAAHLAEVADGAVTDTVTLFVAINRNGANN